jgi:parallel beta-helix repeat protein
MALVMLLCGLGTAKAALNGSYSINAGGGATASNYLTISSAISDLVLGTRADGGPVNGPGVSGPVVLRIAAGTGPYNEQLTIAAIPGASAVNNVRITGGPTRATVQFTGTTTNDRQVFKLSGCKHVTLDSLTIINNGTTFGYGVHITNDADSNYVLNSLITVNAASTSASFAGISISGLTPTTTGNNGDYNTVQGNIVTGGYYGYSCNGTNTTTYSYGNNVINNEFRDFYYYGIRHYEQSGPTISGNKVHARASGTTAGYGMYIYYNDRFTIERNQIYDVGNYGIYMFNANFQGGSGSSRAVVRNNFIGGTMLNVTTPYGIFATTNTTNVDFFHNTVSLTAGNGRCMNLVGGAGNDVRNNIFSITNSTTGYAFYTGTAAFLATANYNDYYAPGSANFVYIVTPYTPATFVGGGGYNLNSINVNPSFVNAASNLHVNANVNLYDVGANLGVMDDFDGDARPMLPSIGYDIGADEFNVSLNDAGAFSLTSPAQPFAAGVQNIDFTLKNFGLGTLTSATLNWRVNGVTQTPYAWTGNLATAAVSTPFTAGTYNFMSGNTYTIKAWTSAPNGGGDSNPGNDTITLNVCVGLSGAYSVGGVGADYPTIGAAIAALQCGGAAGPVTLNLTQGAGPFNEQVIIPSIIGASASRKVRINGGANRETVQFTGTTINERAVFKLNGADHIILDSLTIINNDAIYGHGIHLTNNADSNVVKNCNITVNPGFASTSTNFSGIVMAGQTATTAGASGNGNLISNNVISGGYYGISIQGLSTTVYDQNNSIIGNDLREIYFYGIRAYSQSRDVISGNRIRHRATASTTAYAMYIYYNDLFTIEKNDINNSGSYGIYCYYANFQGGNPIGRARIANNMIGGTWSGNTPYGIFLTTNATNIDVFHNTISLASGNGRAIYITAGTGIDVRNNSFALSTSASGYAAYVTNASSLTTMNYNNYDAPGSSNYVFIGVAYTPATLIGGGGFNLNSRQGAPFYINTATNLHATATQLFDGGDPSVGITTDFDGDLRPNVYSTIPDIGADEYLADTVNIAMTQLLEPTMYLCPDSFQVVKVVIFNKGLNTISNIPITANITGPTNATFSVVHPGPLPLGQADTVTLGTLNTWSGGTFQFEVYNTVPNDMGLADDTLRTSRFINTTPTPPSIAGATVCNGDSTDLVGTGIGNHYWFDANQGGNLVASGDTLHTGPLSTATTYYVESRGQATASLTTTFVGGNGCGGGNMFDVTALQTITIDSFDLNLGSTAVSQVDIYYKIGTYAGFETNAAAWTLLGSTSVTGAGAGQPTRCPIGGLTIPVGQTYGIYVFNPDVDYTTLAATTTYSSPEMQITAGVGLCSLFGGLNNPRGWNGRVYYQAEGCASQRTPVTVNVNAYPTVSIADSTHCGPITLDAGNPGMSYSWSNGDSTQTIVVTTSGSYSVTVSNGNCEAIDTAVIAIGSQPSANLGQDSLLCNGAGMLIDAGSNPGATFLWSNGDTTQTITVNAAGTYYVDVLGGGGCNATDTIVVTTLMIPNGNIGVDSVGCPTVLFTGSNSGGPSTTNNWNFGDTNTGTGTSVSHTYASNGTYVVSFTQDNACGSEVTTTTITINCIMGIEDPSGANVSLYPNPTHGQLELKLDLPMAEDGQVEIIDLHGRIVQAAKHSLQMGSNVIHLDLSSLSTGVYTVVVRSESLQWQGKVVKE